MDAAGAILVELVLGSSILFSLALAADRLLRHRSAALRCQLLFLAFVVLMVLPAGPLLPAIAVPLALPADAIGMPLPADALPASIMRATDRAPFLIFSLWLGGALLFLCRLAAERIRLRRAIGGAWPADTGQRRQLERLRRRLGIRRDVALWTCSRIETPIVAGLLRPRILLPVEAAEWSDTRLAMVLAHELAHVGRFDPVILLVAQAAAALCWFNPLAWLALSRMRLACEQACDDLVLATGARPSAYASHLLALVDEAGGARWPAALSVANESGVESRLRALLDPRRPRQPLSAAAAAVSTGAAAVLTAALAVLHPVGPVGSSFAAARPSITLALVPAAPTPLHDGPGFLVPQHGRKAARPHLRKVPIGHHAEPRDVAARASSEEPAAIPPRGSGFGSGSGFGAGFGSGSGSGAGAAPSVP